LLVHAFEGTEGRIMIDYHVHFFGNGRPECYSYIPELQRLRDNSPPRTNFRRFIHHQKPLYQPFVEGVYLDTIGVRRRSTMDEDYMRRLVELVAWHGSPAHANAPGQSPHRTEFLLYAMDGMYGHDGRLHEDTFNYVANDYIILLAKHLNEKIRASRGFTNNTLVPVGSINPLRRTEDGSGLEMRDRPDWMAQVKLLAANNVRHIKWRPPSMGLDPTVVADEFFEELASHKIGILTHTGDSMGILLPARLNSYAGPRKMRRAVELGVAVTMLHIGRAGTNSVTKQSYAEEFLDELRHHSGHANRLLQGEISAVPYSDTDHLLNPIFEDDPPLRGHMVNGSDYPAVTPWFTVKKTLKKLVTAKLISEDERVLLKEIFQFNPLLFDFVLKRTLQRDYKSLPMRIFAPKPDKTSTTPTDNQGNLP
jgi:hypothetical protein